MQPPSSGCGRACSTRVREKAQQGMSRSFAMSSEPRMVERYRRASQQRVAGAIRVAIVVGAS
eukprot:11169040-Lingulodinium_polyedra.AAC.1